MFFSPHRAARLPLLLAVLVAGTISTFIPVQVAQAASAKPVTKQATIYRCDMRDGSVTFADFRCKGAAKVKTWIPKQIPKGLRRSGPATATAPDVDKLTMQTTSANPEPYVDCKDKGGQFDIYQRICKLPSINTPVMKR